MKPLPMIQLESTNARAARKEVKKLWPNKDVSLYGYIDTPDGLYMVYVTLVRKNGDKAHVATATRGDKRANIFMVGEIKE